MTSEQRVLCDIANRAYRRPHVGRRFNDLVTVRRSWSLWFLARSVGL